MIEQLFIAEKPSVARDIAAVLDPGHVRNSTHIACNGGRIVVSWCRGHLFDTAEPQDYRPEWEKWDVSVLPMIPDRWKRKVMRDTAQQFRALADLLKTTRLVIHAGDADREGQLIVDEVLEEAGYRGEVKRLWLNESNAAGIRKAIASMKDGASYRGMFHAALARQRADWLVGMNATRAFTLRGQQQGSNVVLSVGRVQTPTLAIVVQRDLAIEKFKPRDFFTLSARVDHHNGSFRAGWVPSEGQSGLDEDGRLVDPSIARAVAAKLSGPGVVSKSETTPKSEAPPKGYSLVKLQSEASRLYGYSAEQTLDAAQALYERHKIASYPRTDCEYFPENDHSKARKVLDAIKQNAPALGRGIDKADPARKSGAWNDKQVAKSAHYAIMPVAHTTDPNGLSAVERNIYGMIAVNYVAQFHPNREYEQQRIEVEVNGETLVATGIIEKKAGWRSVFDAPDEAPEDAAAQEEQRLPIGVKGGDAVKIAEGKSEPKKTKPPSYFTEGTLLMAMSNIARYVEDAAMRSLLRESDGIGTPATRASIIETLKKHALLEIKGRGKAARIVSTEAGRALITVVPSSIKDPVLTALFERSMQEIEAGEQSVEALVGSAADLAATLVLSAAEAEIGAIRSKGDVACPVCGSGVLRKRKGPKGPFWGCNRYPVCKTTFPDKKGKPDIEGAGRQKTTA